MGSLIAQAFSFLTRPVTGARRRLREPEKLVAVVVPGSNRPTLSRDEQISMDLLRRNLARYDKYFLTPRGLGAHLDGFKTIKLDPRYFGSAKNLSRLLYRRGFFRLFENYRYILIHHLDSLVLRDELEAWCATGLDYVGAPWVYCADARWVTHARVGNGGFTLMNVTSALRVLSRRYEISPNRFWKDLLESKLYGTRLYARLPAFLRDTEPVYLANDMFWADRARFFVPEYRIASVEEGLRFAFETQPRISFRLNANRLPFGCHAWTRYDRSFWETHVLHANAESDTASAIAAGESENAAARSPETPLSISETPPARGGWISSRSAKLRRYLRQRERLLRAANAVPANHANPDGETSASAPLARSGARGGDSAASEKPYVSVVIPCRNAAFWIADQLAALERQNCGRPWEIILVDNGSTDGSVHEAREFALRLPQMRIVTANERPGAGYARNAGVRASRGELLLFCDADDAVGAGWLDAMVRALENHPFVAARLDHVSLNAPWLHRSRHNVQSTGLIPDVFLPVASGGSLGIRRKLFLTVGGFDETLATNEDHEFCWRVQLRGAPLHFVAEALVHYRHRCTLAETFVQAVRYGRDKLVLLRSYRQAGHDIPMPRWRGYAHEFMRVALEAPLHVWRADSLALWVSDFGYRLGLLLGWLDKPRLTSTRSAKIPGAVANAALRADRSKMRAARKRNHAFFET